ncbi:MAG: transglutaminase family protein [Alphaproteobacteria bacterium]|nr:transglutaminase family protein [Alphaproteobacteria bacterium]
MALFNPFGLRRARTFQVVAFFAALLVFPQASQAVETISPEVEKILALPEKKIDIGTAAIVFAKDIATGPFDEMRYSRELDRLAVEARKLIPPKSGPDEALMAINTVLYQREGFSYDFSPDARELVGNYFLPAVLDTKKGICASLPLLYLAVAQRVGLPVYAVSAPDHSFLRITDPKATYKNIEATSGGTKLDSSYIREFHISEKALAKGTYMRTLTHHEYLASLLAINANYFVHFSQYNKAIVYYERALEIDPHLDVAVLALSIIYRDRATGVAKMAAVDHQEATAQKAKTYEEKANYYEGRLKDLDVATEEYRHDRQQM